MSRIDPARLDDLKDVLDEIRTWDGVDDRGGGTFYLRRNAFLHFHAGPDSRRADVKRPDGWVEFDLPEPASKTRKQRLLKLLRDARGER